MHMYKVLVMIVLILLVILGYFILYLSSIGSSENNNTIKIS